MEICLKNRPLPFLKSSSSRNVSAWSRKEGGICRVSWDALLVAQKGPFFPILKVCPEIDFYLPKNYNPKLVKLQILTKFKQLTN